MWRPVGRYDVGYYDRNNEDSRMSANCAGGIAFGPAYSGRLGGRTDRARQLRLDHGRQTLLARWPVQLACVRRADDRRQFRGPRRAGNTGRLLRRSRACVGVRDCARTAGVHRPDRCDWTGRSVSRRREHQYDARRGADPRGAPPQRRDAGWRCLRVPAIRGAAAPGRRRVPTSARAADTDRRARARNPATAMRATARTASSRATSASLRTGRP